MRWLSPDGPGESTRAHINCASGLARSICRLCGAQPPTVSGRDWSRAVHLLGHVGREWTHAVHLLGHGNPGLETFS